MCVALLLCCSVPVTSNVDGRKRTGTRAMQTAAAAPMQRAFEVKETKEKGRGLYAARNIESGEVLFSERPVYWSPSLKCQKIHCCHHCGRWLGSLKSMMESLAPGSSRVFEEAMQECDRYSISLPEVVDGIRCGQCETPFCGEVTDFFPTQTVARCLNFTGRSALKTQ